MEKELIDPINQSVYNQLKEISGAAILLLEEDICLEITSFLQSQLHPAGGFINRGGRPDLYYSLFGKWIGDAINFKFSAVQLRNWIDSLRNYSVLTFIDLCSLFLLKKELKQRKIYNTALAVHIIYKAFKSRNNINVYYRLFLLLLFMDSFLPSMVRRNLPGKRKLLRKYSSIESSCAELSALLILKTRLQIDYQNDQERLLAYFDGSNGFKVYQQNKHGDMLSTAVALFALRCSGYNCSLIATDCLVFINKNYNKGAFLAGNGDPFRDIEYTFYGLLAIGSLAPNQ